MKKALICLGLFICLFLVSKTFAFAAQDAGGGGGGSYTHRASAPVYTVTAPPARSWSTPFSARTPRTPATISAPNANTCRIAVNSTYNVSVPAIPAGTAKQGWTYTIATGPGGSSPQIGFHNFTQGKSYGCVTNSTGNRITQTYSQDSNNHNVDNVVYRDYHSTPTPAPTSQWKSPFAATSPASTPICHGGFIAPYGKPEGVEQATTLCVLRAPKLRTFTKVEPVQISIPNNHPSAVMMMTRELLPLPPKTLPTTGGAVPETKPSEYKPQ